MTPAPERRATPRLFSLAALRRRGWILPVVVCCAAAVAYLVAASRPISYTAESIVVVTSGASRLGPGAANDAMALARTYAGAIPVDAKILEKVSAAVDRPQAAVERGISVGNDTGTSLLRLDYTDDDRAKAVAGAAALVRAVRGSPRTSAIGRGSVRVVRVADSAVRQAGDTGRALPVGAVLGLVLALLLMVAWERSDPRVDDDGDLRAAFEGPVSELRQLSPAAVGALRDRWRILAGGGPTPTIALIPTARRSRRAAARIAEQLGGEPGFLAAGPPGEADAGELAAVRSDLVVLISRPGTPVEAVRRAQAALEQFDRAPAWAVLVSRRGLASGGDSPTASLPSAVEEPSDGGAFAARRAEGREPGRR
jgi:capsular polysaccharide biosynthesis protein